MDVKLEVSDLVGLAEPLKKLVTVVSAGLGAVYRPMAIRREADARAYEVKSLAQAQAEAQLAIRSLQREETLQLAERALHGNPELVERAKRRVLLREIEGQLNVEAIVQHAEEALPPSVSEAPVEADWRRKFFMEAENICDEDMQKLWGRLLAGEIASPGTFNVRSLETLRRLSRSEAELFRRACAITTALGWIALPEENLDTALKPYGLGFEQLLILREAGLLREGLQLFSPVAKAMHDERPGELSFMIISNGLGVRASGSAAALASRKLPVVSLTLAGKELQRLVEPAASPEYIQAICRVMAKRGFRVQSGPVEMLADGSFVAALVDVAP